jgi:hypothetical protein
VTQQLIYEVECQLDPDIVADYDAWLPCHVRKVLACKGFQGASIEAPETPPGERQRQRRRVLYRVESVAALDHYLENDATQLRAEVTDQFGDRVQCERRVFKLRQELTPAAREPAHCLNCGTVVAGRHCAQCGQAADVHVLSMKEVAGDVTHSLLHLDSRVWRTLRLLIFRPGELTREFIAGRHQLYIPPFRLYLAISIFYFALQALLPDSNMFGVDSQGNTVYAPVSVDVPEELRRELEAEGVSTTAAADSAAAKNNCEITLGTDPRWDGAEATLRRACAQMRVDGGKRFAEHFAATAPKLMFVFLPLMAAVALLFYWKPRRLYAEHLVLFLHNHAFTFLVLGLSSIVSAASELPVPFVGLLDLVNVVLTFYTVWYVFRSMRVVYGQGRLATTFKFLAIGTIYFVLLGITLLAGMLFAMYKVS